MEYVNQSTLRGKKKDLAWPNTSCLSQLSCLTKYHRLGDLNSRNLFPTVLEAGSPRSGGGWGVGQGVLPGLGQLPSPCVLWRGWGGNKHSGISSLKGTNPTGVGGTLTAAPDLHFLPKAPSLYTIPPGARVQHMKYGGHISVHDIQGTYCF